MTVTKEQAKGKLTKPSYDPKKLEVNTEYLIKKMSLSRQELKDTITIPVVPHTY